MEENALISGEIKNKKYKNNWGQRINKIVNKFGDFLLCMICRTKVFSFKLKKKNFCYTW